MLCESNGPSRHHRLLLHQPPVEAVGARRRASRPAVADESLVPLVFVDIGVVVAKGTHVVAGTHPDEVVVLRAVVLVDTEVGLGPVDAVLALGVGGERAVHGLSRTICVTPIPRPEPAALLDRDHVADVAQLVWLLRGDGDAGAPGLVEDTVDAVGFGDPEVVEEELPIGADVDRHRVCHSSTPTQSIQRRQLV